MTKHNILLSFDFAVLIEWNLTTRFCDSLDSKITKNAILYLN